MLQTKPKRRNFVSRLRNAICVPHSFVPANKVAPTPVVQKKTGGGGWRPQPSGRPVGPQVGIPLRANGLTAQALVAWHPEGDFSILAANTKAGTTVKVDVPQEARCDQRDPASVLVPNELLGQQRIGVLTIHRNPNGVVAFQISLVDFGSKKLVGPKSSPQMRAPVIRAAAHSVTQALETWLGGRTILAANPQIRYRTYVSSYLGDFVVNEAVEQAEQEAAFTPDPVEEYSPGFDAGKFEQALEVELGAVMERMVPA